jgi:hypothetical protein
MSACMWQKPNRIRELTKRQTKCEDTTRTENERGQEDHADVSGKGLSPVELRMGVVTCES